MKKLLLVKTVNNIECNVKIMVNVDVQLKRYITHTTNSGT